MLFLLVWSTVSLIGLEPFVSQLWPSGLPKSTIAHSGGGYTFAPIQTCLNYVILFYKTQDIETLLAKYCHCCSVNSLAVLSTMRLSNSRRFWVKNPAKLCILILFERLYSHPPDGTDGLQESSWANLLLSCSRSAYNTKNFPTVNSQSSIMSYCNQQVQWFLFLFSVCLFVFWLLGGAGGGGWSVCRYTSR